MNLTGLFSVVLAIIEVIFFKNTYLFNENEIYFTEYKQKIIVACDGPKGISEIEIYTLV